ncbi:YkoF family thiamine/hydroxymethylpyrimidine-binding protein [Egicoccus sp. AB-alg6-2]|uniref:YkoF family thiamine/hydroxymethylpyrimidine-binding protein n=1 Tax=Egicoccus sp. AB-alg6-2 TaxID=3242692 RepID=UPI00359CE5C6
MSPQPAALRQASPTELGVGARFSVHPMTDDFVSVILGALDDADPGGLTVQTDDVTTWVAGDDREVVAYVVEVLRLAARRTPTGHVVGSVLLSRGCPGSVTCDIGTDVSLPPAATFDLPAAGVPVGAHWALYPLGGDEHLAAIETAIDRIADFDVEVGREHFVTRLDGDLAAVLGAVATVWATLGERVQHVTTHLTVSIGSPSRRVVGTE